MSEEAVLEKPLADEFTWDQMSVDLDYIGEIEPDAEALIENVADRIVVEETPSHEVGGAEIPGSISYSFSRVAEDGSETVEKVPNDIAKKVIAFKTRNELYEKVGRLSDENPDRPDIVMKESKLTAQKLNELGFTRLSELTDEARPVYEERKAIREKEAKEEAFEAREANIAKQIAENEARNEAYAEERKAKEVSKERDQDFLDSVSNNPTKNMSVGELADAAGMSYGEALRAGKSEVVRTVQERVSLREKVEEENKTVKIRDNSKAEEDQSEYASLLKEHDKAGLKAALEGPELGSSDSSKPYNWADEKEPFGSNEPYNWDSVEDELDVPEFFKESSKDNLPDVQHSTDLVVVNKEEAPDRGLRSRIKAAIALLPSRIRSREKRDGPMSERRKMAYKIGAVAATVTVLAGGAWLASSNNEPNEKGGFELASHEVETPKEGNLLDLGVVPAEAPANKSVNLVLPAEFGGPAQEVVSVSATETLEVDASSTSWDVAHNLSPGNETGVMQGAIDKFNEAHSTSFTLTPKGDTVWIMDGGQAISPEQMAELNSYMVA